MKVHENFINTRKQARLVMIKRSIDLFGGTGLIALDILDKTEKTPGHRKNTEVT